MKKAAVPVVVVAVVAGMVVPQRVMKTYGKVY